MSEADLSRRERTAGRRKSFQQVLFSKLYEHKLDVPPVPPSSLNHCGLIDLKYKLIIEACVSGL